MLAAIAAGCGVNGAAWRPIRAPAGHSAIYLYRPYEFLSSGSAPIITCGHETIELEAGGYYAFVERSGPIVCSAQGGAAPELRFDARPGEACFVREEVESGIGASRAQFSLRNGGAGRDEIVETRLQAPLPTAGQ